MPKRHKVTLTEIAAVLGVAPSTVSNAYNRPDQLSPALRQKILETATSLGYGGPDPVARSLRRRQAGAVGVLYSAQLSYAFSDPVAVLVLQGVAMAAEAAGLGLLLIPGMPEEESRAEMVSNALVDGFIVYSMPENDPAIDAVLSRQMPTVFVDQPPRGNIPFVGIEDESGARAAAEHLLALGHRRFVILVDRLAEGERTGIADEARQNEAVYLPIRARLQGYKQAICAAGLDWSTVIVYECEENTEESARQAVAELLAQGQHFTALLAFSDRLALGAMAVIQANGYAVPDDISVVGFDDIPAAATATPPLTTVHQPHVEKGRMAGSLLIDQLHGEATADFHILPTRLIVRASTAEAKGMDER